MTNEQVENVMSIAFELARIREEHGAQSGMYLSEVRALRAEVERLAAQAAPTERDAQDAARYQWLRDKAVWITTREPAPWCVIGTCANDARPCDRDELDAAIDAAMAKD